MRVIQLALLLYDYHCNCFVLDIVMKKLFAAADFVAVVAVAAVVAVVAEDNSNN